MTGQPGGDDDGPCAPPGFTGTDRRVLGQQSSKAEDLAVVGLVLSQMNLLEARLGTKIDAVTGMTVERWRVHEEEHQRFDGALGAVVSKLDSHLRSDEMDDLVYNARMGVVKRAGSVITREWRTIAIIGFLLLDFWAQIAQSVQSLFRP